MEAMTARQAAEYGKTLDFEKVWASLMETRAQMAESFKKTDAQIAELTKNVSGINRSMGRWTEEMYAAKLCEKINILGYEFTKIGQRIKLRESGRVIAEIDIFLENGDAAMPVEVKTDLGAEDVDGHIERIEKIRQYMDSHGDRRNLAGAVAGAIVPESVCRYAQKKGLYVLVQSGDSVAVAAAPQSFIPRIW